MDLKSTNETRVFVEVRSKGILGALEHHLIFSGTPEAIAVTVGDGAIDAPIEGSIAVAKLEPTPETSSSDRDRMLDNIRGRDVLDAKKNPNLAFRGNYRGTLDEGKLEGDLTVRGTPRRISFAVRGRKTDDGMRFDATWEGVHADLGLKPFKAMLGALQLRDWIKIRIEAVFRPS